MANNELTSELVELCKNLSDEGKLALASHMFNCGVEYEDGQAIVYTNIFRSENRSYSDSKPCR